VAAGILACRRGRHLAARKKRSHGETIEFNNDSPGGGTIPPGWKPRLYVSQDGRRYLFQTASEERENQEPFQGALDCSTCATISFHIARRTC
jgi:hypothetical protein